MNEIKVNFKAAAYYFETLKEVIQRTFTLLEQLKEDEKKLSKNELDFHTSNLIHIFMVIEPILDLPGFTNKLFTKDEENLLNWFYQKRALWFKEYHSEIFDTLPLKITKYYYSFTDKK